MLEVWNYCIVLFKAYLCIDYVYSIQVNHEWLEFEYFAKIKLSYEVLIMDASVAQNIIEQDVIEIVANTLKVKKDSITLESRFVEDLKADSLDTVELMMAIEAKYKCDIPDEDASKILTVSDVVQYINKKITN